MNTAAEIVDVAVGLAPTVAAVGIRRFGFAMIRSDKVRAAQAAEDSEVTQGMPAALQELVRRTSPPRVGPADQALGRPVEPAPGGRAREAARRPTRRSPNAIAPGRMAEGGGFEPPIEVLPL